MKKISTLLVGALLALCTAGAAELTPELIADLKMVQDVRLSPDGKSVSYLLEGEMEGGGKGKELWLATVDGAPAQRRLLADRNQVSLARWSADGRLAVVALSDAAPRRRQLLLVNAATGEARVLVDRFEGAELEWSPDGRQLGFIDSERAAPAPRRPAGEPMVLTNEPPEGGGAVSRFYTLDLSNGTAQARTPATHTLTDFAWSPRGDAIVALARSVKEGARRAVTVFNLATNAAPRELWRPEDQTNFLAWSPDGKTIAWCGREFRPDAGQLVLMNAEGDPAARTAQKDFPGSLHHLLFRPDGRVAFAAQVNLRIGIYSVAVDGSDLRTEHPAESFAPGSLGAGSLGNFTMSFSADGSRVACAVSGPREFANVIAGPWRGSLTRRTALNPAVADVALGTVDEISWKSFDGLEIHGFLVKPVGFNPAKKYPMVVMPHGGPRRSWWATCVLEDWSGWLAHQGYVVLMPNPRGSEGRGADFVRANRMDLGGGDWRDIVAGLDHVLTLGFVDPERLAIAGWSYGGYLTAWGITQPEGRRFKAAVVGAGIANRLAKGGAAGSWSEVHYGDPQAIWRNPQEFFYRSPLAHVSRVTAPTLIVHGDNDSKVPHAQALDFFTGLRALGVQTEARIYPGEGHNFTRRDHRIDLLNSIARWLRTYVPPDAVGVGKPGKE